MIDLRIVEPRPEGAPVKFGEPVVVVVDLGLDEPWFALPALGSRLNDLDGEPEPALFFETPSGASVKALASGRAETRDTGEDDHSGPGARSGRARRGCEVTVKTGSDIEITYSHLKRGSAKTGSVRAGDAIGASGNSGRCPNGARRSFVKIAAKRRAANARIEDFTEPLTVEATLNGLPLGAPTRVPGGEVVVKGLKLERVPALIEKEDQFRSGDNELYVALKRGSRTLARATATVRIEG